MVTASLLHVLGCSKNTRDLCCFLEVPAGSGPRPLLLQSPGSGPNHTVRAQAVATAGLQGHHPPPAVLTALGPPRLPLTCRPSPGSRCSRAGPGPASQGPALLGQACPAWYTCMCHACARTPPPSGPRGHLCALGARASASPALVLLNAAPALLMVTALDLVNMSFLFIC